MASRRPTIAQQRLARVRAIKEQFFTEELTLEQRLEVKEARIAELEKEILDLKALLREQRSQPESTAPQKPAFDFYRND
ncbi:MAG: hypothetical protein R8J94_04860 [Acidimicrobiia bacterium]|nr:hypothetical protein [Acidimicrobiia bacterium]